MLTKEIFAKPTQRDGVLAWFISPHGFGHAARASAIIVACSSQCRGLHYHLFTTVPQEFFSDSLPGVSFDYHRLECDVGMVQASPLVEDVDGTIRALDRLPLDSGPVFDSVVAKVAATGCRLIVSDIAPLGLAVANQLAVPGVLVENFTWDWIYSAYGDLRLDRYGKRLAAAVHSATLTIQAEPFCRSAKGAHTVAPISRRQLGPRHEVRRLLGVPNDHRMVLLSVAGLDGKNLGRLRFWPPPTTTLVVPGTGNTVRAEGGVIRIPTLGGPYHPDLVAASDLVVAKLGYSTIAEVYHAGTAMAYLRRPLFPETPVLEAFVKEHIPSAALPEDWLENSSTQEIFEDLLAAPRPTGARPNGAGEAANLILSSLQPQF